MATRTKAAPKQAAATKTTKSAKSAIRPIGDQILVKRVEAEEVTAGGILLPESAKEKPKEGIIIALGEGKTLENGERSTFAVKAGDHVLFTSYAGTEVKYAGQEYLIMRESDMLAVIEG
jgi:chaperonin GroES